MTLGTVRDIEYGKVQVLRGDNEGRITSFWYERDYITSNLLIKKL